MVHKKQNIKIKNLRVGGGIITLTIKNESSSGITVRLYNTGFIGRGTTQAVTPASTLITPGCSAPFNYPDTSSFFDRFKRLELLVSKVNIWTARVRNNPLVSNKPLCQLPEGNSINSRLDEFARANPINFVLVPLSSIKGNVLVIHDSLFRQQQTPEPCPANAPGMEVGEMHPVCVYNEQLRRGGKVQTKPMMKYCTCPH